MRFRGVLPAVCVAAIGSIGACAGPARDRAADSVATAESTAPITDSLRGPGAREGQWQGADQRSTWRAVLDGPRVTQFDELALFTDSTRATRQFTFDSAGYLARVREERTQTVFGNKATPDTLHTIIELEWRLDSLVRSAKRLNGAERLIQPYEVDNLRLHAEDLVRTARAGASTRTPGH